MPTQELDFLAVAVVTVFAAGLFIAVRTLWGAAAAVKNHLDLIRRELTGWHDPATGEDHPSLRSELHAQRERLECMENDTRQLRRNGGSHLADRLAVMAQEVSEVKESVGDLSQQVGEVKTRMDEVHPVTAPRRRRTKSQTEVEK